MFSEIMDSNFLQKLLYMYWLLNTYWSEDKFVVYVILQLLLSIKIEKLVSVSQNHP
jgi:hypothetical protein